MQHVRLRLPWFMQCRARYYFCCSDLFRSFSLHQQRLVRQYSWIMRAPLYTAWTIAWKNKFASLDVHVRRTSVSTCWDSPRSFFISAPSVLTRAARIFVRYSRNPRNKCVLREHWTSFKQWRISVRQDTTRHRLEHDKWDVLKSSWSCKRSRNLRYAANDRNDPSYLIFSCTFVKDYLVQQRLFVTAYN